MGFFTSSDEVAKESLNIFRERFAGMIMDAQQAYLRMKEDSDETLGVPASFISGTVIDGVTLGIITQEEAHDILELFPNWAPRHLILDVAAVGLSGKSVTRNPNGMARPYRFNYSRYDFLEMDDFLMYYLLFMHDWDGSGKFNDQCDHFVEQGEFIPGGDGDLPDGVVQFESDSVMHETPVPASTHYSEPPSSDSLEEVRTPAPSSSGGGFSSDYGSSSSDSGFGGGGGGFDGGGGGDCGGGGCD